MADRHIIAIYWSVINKFDKLYVAS